MADLLDRVPTTSKAAEYGTPEMACEIIQLFQTGEVHRRKLFVIAGHEGGIVTFGSDLEEAFAVLMQERNETAQLR